MLDTPTKKRIDDCRDILVGKLPDPKAQIEQITIALIYKFMDDMDKEAVELGGKVKFFADYKTPDPENPNDRKKDKTIDFNKYAWDRLFDAKVTATEMLRLYSEGLEGMEKNPNIPGLFRDIFKNAYLPYRDPETLKLFLRTISEFNYTHSEMLGDAFEYLLSVMGSQGDAGQFRTPRHIIDFLVAVVNPGKNDTVLDPACGTAGFLISAFKHIMGKGRDGRDGRNDHVNDVEHVNHGDQRRDKACLVSTGKTGKTGETGETDLTPVIPVIPVKSVTPITPDEQKKIIKNFVGYDISPDMVRLSLVNLYLHGFSEPHIWEYDALSSEERWDENYDVILANPPFMSPKGGIRPHKKFTISSNRSEVLFVDYIAEHLNPKGRAGIIVPEGAIFQSGTAYKALRKMLVENYLYAVVSLPAGVFNPYSGVKTRILLMDKELAKKNKEILFVKIGNDGYGLGAQRNAVKGGQLEEAIQLIQQFKEGKFDGNEMAHAVAKNEIGNNGDWNLSGERYKKIILGQTEFELFELEELFDIKRGGSPRPIEDFFTNEDDGINWIKIGDVAEGTKYVTSTKQKIKPEGLKMSRLVEPGDFILSNSMSYGRPYILNITGAIHDGWLVFKQKKNNLNKDYIFNILSSQFVKEQFAQSATGGVVKNLNIELVKRVKIPLPPLPIQEAIVAEIEGYQKIIDGAKMVVDNYKPHIDTDPDWEMMELGEVCNNLQYGSSRKSNLTGDVVCLRMGNIQNGEIDWSDLKYAPKDEELEEYLLQKGDVLFNRTNSPVHVGKTGIYRGERKAVFAGYLIRLNYKKNKIIGEYLNYCLNTKDAKAFCQRVKTDGINQSNINAKILGTFPIPIPSIFIQKQIVTQIEKEQSLVNANKELIAIYEQKIKDRIAKVWGTDKKEPVVYEENNLLTMAAED